MGEGWTKQMKIEKVKNGWKIKVWFPFEWIPHKHNFVFIGYGWFGNTIEACKWCGKEKRGKDINIHRGLNGK